MLCLQDLGKDLFSLEFDIQDGEQNTCEMLHASVRGRSPRSLDQG